LACRGFVFSRVPAAAANSSTHGAGLLNVAAESNRDGAMKPYDAHSALISLHVPKTGGTSLQQVLASWFPDGRLLLHYRAAGKPPPRHELVGGTCVHGHFNTARGLGVDIYYPDAEQFIAFVRNPFERFLSDWFFMNHRKQSGVRIYQLDGDPDFETFLHARAEEQRQNRNAISMHWHFPSSNAPHLISEAMDSRFVFIGIMERFQPSLDALAAILGKPAAKIGHVNITERPAHDLNSWRPFYEKNFSVEFEIYEAARTRNRELIAQYLS
jgi:hypothetical protein